MAAGIAIAVAEATKGPNIQATTSAAAVYDLHQESSAEGSRLWLHERMFSGHGTCYHSATMALRWGKLTTILRAKNYWEIVLILKNIFLASSSPFFINKSIPKIKS